MEGEYETVPKLSNGTIFIDLWPLVHISRSPSNNVTDKKSYMIYRMVQFPVNFSDPWPTFQGHGVTINALDVL